MNVLLVVGFAVSSVGNLLTGLAWAVAAAFTVQTVRGLGIAAMDVATNTLLPRLVPATMLGRVFGNLYGAIGVAAALSYVGGSVLLDLTSAPVTLVVAGGLGTLATVVTALALRRALTPSSSRVGAWPDLAVVGDAGAGHDVVVEVGGDLAVGCHVQQQVHHVRRVQLACLRRHLARHVVPAPHRHAADRDLLARHRALDVAALLGGQVDDDRAGPHRRHHLAR